MLTIPLYCLLLFILLFISIITSPYLLLLHSSFLAILKPPTLSPTIIGVAGVKEETDPYPRRPRAGSRTFHRGRHVLLALQISSSQGFETRQRLVIHFHTLLPVFSVSPSVYISLYVSLDTSLSPS